MFWPQGSPLDFGLSVSGFEYFGAKGFAVEPCGQNTVDYAEITTALGGLDGVRTALAAQLGAVDPLVEGTVREANGEPAIGAWVFVEQAGVLYTRARTGKDGRYQVHAPAGSTLQAYAEGHELPPVVPATPGTVDLALPAVGHAESERTDADTLSPLPVRIQVIPTVPPPALRGSFGITQPEAAALEPRYALHGEARFVVPPGEHRVIVSRGYEWEVFDGTFTVGAGETAGRELTLKHSVDSTGTMCADFHIHSNLSFDSDDVVRQKVASAIADGLELPISSEHEWVLDFMPTIRDLGVEPWAFSFSSEELTTFGNGHFGVVPLSARPERRNNGAIHWVGRRLGEVFAEVRSLPEKPVLIVNHPSSGGFLGYFLTTQFDPQTATGSGE
ncbi:MAG: hypothetical protein EOP08_13340, partial [Proteobacteria bacterium]